MPEICPLKRQLSTTRFSYSAHQLARLFWEPLSEGLGLLWPAPLVMVLLRLVPKEPT